MPATTPTTPAADDTTGAPVAPPAADATAPAPDSSATPCWSLRAGYTSRGRMVLQRQRRSAA